MFFTLAPHDLMWLSLGKVTLSRGKAKFTHTLESVRSTHQSWDRCPAKKLTHVRVCKKKNDQNNICRKKSRFQYYRFFMKKSAFPQLPDREPQTLTSLESWRCQLSPCVISLGCQTKSFVKYNVSKLRLRVEANYGRNIGIGQLKRYSTPKK